MVLGIVKRLLGEGVTEDFNSEKEKPEGPYGCKMCISEEVREGCTEVTSTTAEPKSVTAAVLKHSLVDLEKPNIRIASVGDS